MAPTLYYAEISPPVRSVLLTSKALDISLNLKPMNIQTGEQRSPEFVKLNPQHTIPTLVDDDFVIWDSHAINAYLVGKYGKNDSLYPKDLKKRAVVDQRLHFDSGILFPRVLRPARNIIFRNEKEVSKENADNIVEAYNLLEAFLEGRDYVAGNQLTIADFSAVASITSMAVLQPIPPSEYPRITAWLGRMKALPYYNDGNGNGLAQFEQAIKSKLA